SSNLSLNVVSDVISTIKLSSELLIIESEAIKLILIGACVLGSIGVLYIVPWLSRSILIDKRSIKPALSLLDFNTSIASSILLAVVSENLFSSPRIAEAGALELSSFKIIIFA